MNLLDGWDVNTLMYIFLLTVGGIFMVFQLKLMLFPDKKGKIIEFEDFSEAACKECKTRNRGKMSYRIKVQTDAGEVVEAEVSPCTICMDRLKIGSEVGVTKMGTRTIAQSCINLRAGGGKQEDTFVNNNT